MSYKLFASSYDYTLEDYIEYLKDMDSFDEEKVYVEDDAFYDWVQRTQENDCEDFWDNIGYSSIKGSFAITGSLGLWNGHPTIQPVLCPDIKSAIERCVMGGSIIDFDVYYEDGHYVVYAYHHDGTNTFELYQLTDDGYFEASQLEADGELDDIADEWIDKIAEDNRWLY